MSIEAMALLETNHQVDASDDFQSLPTLDRGEINVDDWDAELTNFVAANEHELVECPWQPGIVMTLSAVTLEWPVLITPENVDFVLTELLQLLANKMQMVEENPEDDPETAEITKKLESSPKPVANTVKQSSNALHEPGQQIVINKVAMPKPLAAPPSKTPIIASSTRTNPTTYSSASTADTLPSTKNTKNSTERRKTKTQTYQEIQEPYIEIANFNNIVDTPKKVGQTPLTPPLQEIDRSAIPNELLYSRANHTKEIASDIATVQIPEVINDEAFETNKRELFKDEIVKQDDFSQAEDTIIKINESVEQSGIETAQIIHKIITKIIDAPTDVDYEDSIDEDQLQEEIIVLFAELLDTLGIDYTRELLESLSRLTLSSRFAPMIEDVTDIDDIEKPNQSSSTSKIVQQLTVTLAHIRATIDQACAIGESALRHFGLSLANSEQ